MDPYSVLGVTRQASMDDIEAAFRKLAAKHHPDKNIADEAAAAKFKEVSDAYDQIRNPSKARHHPPPPPPPNSTFSFFAGAEERGRNVQVMIDITLEEVLAGCSKQVEVEQKGTCGTCAGKGFSEYEACKLCSGSGRAFVKQHPFNLFMSCSGCRGTGRAGTIRCVDCVGTGWTPQGKVSHTIVVQPGSLNGSHVRLPNQGEPGRAGGRAGDLFIVVRVADHAIFTAAGTDLLMEVPLAFTHLVLGRAVTVPKLGGGRLVFSVPPQTADGTKFRLKGHGLPRSGPAGRGDLIVTVRLELPDVNPEYAKLLKRLAILEEEYVGPRRAAYKTKLGEDS